MSNRHAIRLASIVIVAFAMTAWGFSAWGGHQELPGAIQEEAPYNTDEAAVFPPPWESAWEGTNNPGKCSGCHTGMFDMWNGSMMANSWRDPIWRAAFFLLGRATATDGNCDIPTPPDGTARSLLNPFANGDCTSTFDLGTGTHTTSGSGSLLDEFCSACHMPTNYIDNVAPDGTVDPNYDPTSAAGTSHAYATVDTSYTNTEAGKRGIFCKVCHSMVESRETPFHNYIKSGTDYVPALGSGSRDNLLGVAEQDLLSVADPLSPNLGYGIGARAYKLSPHAIERPERFGPLSFNDNTGLLDPYISDVFDISFNYEQGDFSRHDGFYSAFMERGEWCGMCHDVTNPLPIKNQLGFWTGSFPIERTYTEYRNSRYADRPGNANFDPASKRDCQTCHMQQDFGQPGTAQTLYAEGSPVAPIEGEPCDRCDTVPVFYTHHFVGGNAYLSDRIGAAVSSNGAVQPYPELSNFSFSSADPNSVYHSAYFENVGDQGPETQHARMAWDRLRNALDLTVSGPASAAAGTTQALNVTVSNTGAGHNFPTGFPEARNGWVAVRAWDLESGTELEIQDSFWNRTSVGVGYLTAAAMVDPNFPGCNWTQPAGAPDPYAYQFRAVGSLGDGCPTLALPYATPLNLVTNAQGLPIDAGGVVIDGNNPQGLPRFTDVDGDGDVFDDAFLVDSRLRPLPHAGATVSLDRYSVVIPPGTVGPVALTAQVYYQSVEAVVAVELLGNLADLDTDHLLEPCVLGGPCDGRMPTVEPAVVEGSPPVPMEAASWVIQIDGDALAPSTIFQYPADGAAAAHHDAVVKVGFCEPVVGMDAATFTLVDGGGQPVPADVDQVADGVWGLFPHVVFLPDDTYTARVSAPICDTAGNCLTQDVVWSFATSASAGSGSTQVPLGFGPGHGGGVDLAPYVTAIDPPDGQTQVLRDADVVVTFSESVSGFDAMGGFALYEAGGNGKNCNTLGAQVAGVSSMNVGGDVWTFNPNATLPSRTVYCVTVGTVVMDLDGTPTPLDPVFASSFKTGNN